MTAEVQFSGYSTFATDEERDRFYAARDALFRTRSYLQPAQLRLIPEDPPGPAPWGPRTKVPKRAKSSGDVEVFVLVDEAPLDARLAEIAKLCARVIDGHGADPTTIYGFALEVLHLADPETDLGEPAVRFPDCRVCEECGQLCEAPGVAVCDRCAWGQA